MEQERTSSRLVKLQSVQGSMLEAVSGEQLQLSRAVPFGGAATALAILIAITQVQSRALDVQVAVVGAAFALPLWLTQATIYEFYLYLGNRSYVHYKASSTQSSLKRLGYLAGISVAASVGGLIHCLIPWAIWVYAAAIAVSVYMLHAFHISLADWWHSQSSSAAPPQ